ncbi:uncharacterized protein N0V89_011799 [Didymosphaeria variabile]|uniref:Uncharacterized protein n=1 Tax=Didymosphaeria variabile TaxID=1932322 RepID=A0A9W9C634_9PLEO|nr:uncharacterized protein N0V89_011799 [Didymosphaeria variabile]KAJ4345664.1 hypothetical protein N0V89_011799 [Didymosphaeria variabile]
MTSNAMLPAALLGMMHEKLPLELREQIYRDAFPEIRSTNKADRVPILLHRPCPAAGPDLLHDCHACRLYEKSRWAKFKRSAFADVTRNPNASEFTRCYIRGVTFYWNAGATEAGRQGHFPVGMDRFLRDVRSLGQGEASVNVVVAQFEAEEVPNALQHLSRTVGVFYRNGMRGMLSYEREHPSLSDVLSRAAKLVASSIPPHIRQMRQIREEVAYRLPACNDDDDAWEWLFHPPSWFDGDALPVQVLQDDEEICEAFAASRVIQRQRDVDSFAELRHGLGFFPLPQVEMPRLRLDFSA